MLTVVCSSSSSLTENQTFSLVSFARPWVHYGKDLCDQLAAIGLALPKGTKMTNKSLDERVSLTDCKHSPRSSHLCSSIHPLSQHGHHLRNPRASSGGSARKLVRGKGYWVFKLGSGWTIDWWPSVKEAKIDRYLSALSLVGK